MSFVARTALAALVLLYSTGCGPSVPPVVVPVEAPPFEPFQNAIQNYLDRTAQYRRDSAQRAAAIRDQSTTPERAEEAVRLRERTLAAAIVNNVRPGARQGDVFSPAIAEYLRQQLTLAFDSPRADLIRDELREQNEGELATPATPVVNQAVDAPRVPPMLLEALPRLPEQLQFDFQGRTLILRDGEANLIVDLLPDAFPERPEPAPSVAATPPAQSSGIPVLPMPDIPGATVFAAIGDSGTGDDAQYEVAASMLRYFNLSRRFSFVIMLGDNLYGDDYVEEFSTPYKELLDRGIRFYAALGNHDRANEIYYKPFNMSDRNYYAFTRGNATFVVLDSNKPSSETQRHWLDTAFGDTGSRWRIAYFHHPLYSSGDHARQSRETIRPALEAALVKNKVDVVFGGHEHLYERVKPQQGVRYFVSGGGGRNLYSVTPGDFDEVAISTFHFMVLSIAGDRMFFEAVTPGDRLIDCGLLWRTKDAEAGGADRQTAQWLEACHRALQEPPTSAQR